MAELKVLIRECGYEENMENILLKDQFIFGVTVKEIQEHLLNNIEDEHDLNNCLQEARKIESHIAQRKQLGLKSVLYDSIGNQKNRDRSTKNQNLRTDLSPDSNPVEVLLKTVSIVAQVTNIDNAQPVGKIVRHVVKRTIMPKSVGLRKAKAKDQVVLSTNHLNTEK